MAKTLPVLILSLTTFVSASLAAVELQAAVASQNSGEISPLGLVASRNCTSGGGTGSQFSLNFPDCSGSVCNVKPATTYRDVSFSWIYGGVTTGQNLTGYVLYVNGSSSDGVRYEVAPPSQLLWSRGVGYTITLRELTTKNVGNNKNQDVIWRFGLLGVNNATELCKEIDVRYNGSEIFVLSGLLLLVQQVFVRLATV